MTSKKKDVPSKAGHLIVPVAVLLKNFVSVLSDNCSKSPILPYQFLRHYQELLKS